MADDIRCKAMTYSDKRRCKNKVFKDGLCFYHLKSKKEEKIKLSRFQKKIDREFAGIVEDDEALSRFDKDVKLR